MNNGQTQIAEDIILRVVSDALSVQIDEVELVDRLKIRRFNHIARLLHYRIATLPDPEIRKECSSLVDELAEEAAGRLLRSPALCELLRAGGAGQDLAALLEAEAILSRKEETVYRERWSALGNVWLSSASAKCPFPLRPHRGRHVGPELGCGIPIDLSLPPAVGRPSAGLQKPRLLDQSETIEAVELLDESIDLLGQVSPIGHAMVVGLTSNIVLRADTARSTESWSASSGAAIGRTVIVNPVLAGGSHFVAEFLLHEATHTALDCIELDNPLISDSCSVEAAGIISPWTGNPLAVHAYLHACIVWAVLLGYWAQYRKAFPESDDAERRLTYIRRGFEAADIRKPLDRFEEALSVESFRIIETAREFGLAVGRC